MHVVVKLGFRDELILYFPVSESEVDYIERLLTQHSDTESEEAVFRNGLYKPLDAALSPLPQSPFTKSEVDQCSSDTGDSSSVSFSYMFYKTLLNHSFRHMIF